MQYHVNNEHDPLQKRPYQHKMNIFDENTIKNINVTITNMNVVCQIKDWSNKKNNTSHANEISIIT